MQKQQTTENSWWGEFHFSDQQCLQWQVGALRMIVQFQSGEWRIAHKWQETDDDELIESWQVADSDTRPEDLAETARYVFRQASGDLKIAPLLADRPVISRPRTPFNLTAGEAVTLYVSTPVWLQLAVGNAAKVLTEVASQRLSDTWFGPSTQEGELCYASKTSCRLSTEELPLRPHRAVTPVVIRNQANTTLSLERLNVPAPLLRLYATPSGQFWTSQLTLVREEDGDMAALKIASQPPREAQDALLLAQPRKAVSSKLLMRAFNALFS